MSTPQSKGLVTSLVLFITVGLFSLATLFTVLILEVRSGQQQINQRLATLSGSPLPTVNASTTSQERFSMEQLAQMQGTIELIATRQRVSSTPDYSAQLKRLGQKIVQLQQSISEQSEQLLQPQDIVASIPTTLIEQITQINQSHAKQRAQIELQQQQLQQIVKQQQLQQQQTTTIEQQLTSLAERPAIAAPEVDLSPLQTTNKSLKRLFEQQSSLQTTQQQLAKLVKKISSNKAQTSSALPAIGKIEQQLETVAAQQKKLLTTQSHLQQLIREVADGQRTPPPVQSAEVAPQQLQELNRQLQQLTQQQQLSERNLLKPMEQSNTIKPYSYNAR